MDNELLISLPDEILLKIFKDQTLSVRDVLNLSMSCQRFEYIAGSQDLWKSKFSQKWPWIWKRILIQQRTSKDWKNEVCIGVKSANTLNERLQTFSYQLYKYENITAPVLAPILSLLNNGSFGILILLNELRNILKEDSYRNLTKKYYAHLVLHHLHQIECRENWQHFFDLPSSEMTLERGAFYFAKWFQPNEFLEFEYKHMTDEFDSLALQVLSQLRDKYPNHPAVGHTLLNPDNMATECLWPKKECEQLFECINDVIFSVNKYKGNEDYYLMVIKTKKGIPVTLSILYLSVCHRLGIVLSPVNCPSHFMLKWLVPNTEDYEFIDAFNGGSRTNAQTMFRGNHPTISGSSGSACRSLQVLDRMANNTIHVAERNFRHQGRFKELCSAVEMSSIFKPNKLDTLEFIYNLYLKMGIHADRIVAGCKEMLNSESQAPRVTERFNWLLEEAEEMLEDQKKDPAAIVPKRRMKEFNVRFATGMVMKHKLYDYTCVIFGWDTTCMMPMKWILQMDVLSLEYQQHQPFYNVLVADGSQRYAAQENLLLTPPTLVAHDSIGKYFDEFNGQYYLPNKELAAEYPYEEDIRKSYYP